MAARLSSDGIVCDSPSEIQGGHTPLARREAQEDSQNPNLPRIHRRQPARISRAGVWAKPNSSDSICIRLSARCCSHHGVHVAVSRTRAVSKGGQNSAKVGRCSKDQDLAICHPGGESIPKASSSDSPLRRAQASGTSTASAAARKMPTAASAPRTDPAPSIQLQQTATADSTNAQASTSTPQSYRDESTSTDDQASLVSRIGFEPRSTSGLPDPSMRTNEAIVWLDIDNTLYKRSTRIAELMAERIRAYFHGMGLSQEEARSLHSTYYKTYGLAIRGLVKHHQIDPLDYDRKCDASLPSRTSCGPTLRSSSYYLTWIAPACASLLSPTPTSITQTGCSACSTSRIRSRASSTATTPRPTLLASPSSTTTVQLCSSSAPRLTPATTLSTTAHSTSWPPRNSAGTLASTFARRTILCHRRRRQWC